MFRRMGAGAALGQNGAALFCLLHAVTRKKAAARNGNRTSAAIQAGLQARGATLRAASPQRVKSRAAKKRLSTTSIRAPVSSRWLAMRTCALPHPPTAMHHSQQLLPPLRSPPRTAVLRQRGLKGGISQTRIRFRLCMLLGFGRGKFSHQSTPTSHATVINEKANALSFYFKRPLAGSSASKRTRCRARPCAKQAPSSTGQAVAATPMADQQRNASRNDGACSIFETRQALQS